MKQISFKTLMHGLIIQVAKYEKMISHTYY